ncbi:MAG TPA: cob(I)yrinic acid a,c-diamide adenosyltransferase [Burkholderiales bacterium]|jgi:cob(I)alamin adenosyltransferase|nr:cob(I)yrinic acid a,c-diamide adenosyltransferase [Burkholderiales bacterium]
MGHRLSKITTRTGDAGETGLGDGSRLPKDHPRIAALGDIDELNSVLGLLGSEAVSPEMGQALRRIQSDLFDLGGEISIPGHRLLQTQQIERLEKWAEQFNADLPPLKEFILPGGSRVAALAHVARSVCRRAERSLVTLSREDAVEDASRIYLNRLSDLLFIWARVFNRQAGLADLSWERQP